MSGFMYLTAGGGGTGPGGGGGELTLAVLLASAAGGGAILLGGGALLDGGLLNTSEWSTCTAASSCLLLTLVTLTMTQWQACAVCHRDGSHSSYWQHKQPLGTAQTWQYELLQLCCPNPSLAAPAAAGCCVLAGDACSRLGVSTMLCPCSVGSTGMLGTAASHGRSRCHTAGRDLCCATAAAPLTAA